MRGFWIAKTHQVRHCRLCNKQLTYDTEEDGYCEDCLDSVQLLTMPVCLGCGERVPSAFDLDDEGYCSRCSDVEFD